MTICSIKVYKGYLKVLEQIDANYIEQILFQLQLYAFCFSQNCK